MSLKVQTIVADFLFGLQPEFTLSQSTYTMGAKPMSWNYRVILEEKDAKAPLSIDTFTIREVFYDDEGEIIFWSEESEAAIGETYQELADEFDLMAEAFELPALKIVDTEDGPKLVEVEVEYKSPDVDVDIRDNDE